MFVQDSNRLLSSKRDRTEVSTAWQRGVFYNTAWAHGWLTVKREADNGRVERENQPGLRHHGTQLHQTDI